MQRRAAAQSVGRAGVVGLHGSQRKSIAKEQSIGLVKIVDSIMGSGKTTWYMEYVNRYPEQKYIIVVPYICLLYTSRCV